MGIIGICLKEVELEICIVGLEKGLVATKGEEEGDKGAQ